ncbi:structural protein [Pseudomonas aeruginosa]|uniref:structural protein P5 n=1 Tax=Pseudomonas aeruginosa TaxID=287 RepID=UPI0003C39702|nr:structural protein P5 [Pseudomonas aeruginosa]ESR73102.1 structural protein P5 [Pseudomonas aeruginosa VRFPA05]EJV1365820.1 structural protein [Pseudomonas aeruginosa]EJV1383432.1 structural protein [Pseudomonas aeruginosa]EJV1606343.1 structural protein [Pseudomonas aeruginosa]EKD1562699.1 structural protein [Pseudomonas aeruginosa]
MRSNPPRGIRNFNPGNIRHTKGTRWQGMSANQNDSAFVQFTGPQWGIRAIARTLITYQDKHALRTIRQIISRWAPPSENNTESYIRQVAARVGVAPDARIDVYDYRTMRTLVEAIVRHENGPGPLPEGSWYGEGVINEGLHLAGIVAGAYHGEPA